MRTVLHCLPPKDWTEPGFMGLGMIYTAMPVTNAVPAVVAPSRASSRWPTCRRSPGARRCSRRRRHRFCDVCRGLLLGFGVQEATVGFG